MQQHIDNPTVKQLMARMNRTAIIIKKRATPDQATEKPVANYQ